MTTNFNLTIVDNGQLKKIESWLLKWISNFLLGDYTGLHVIIAEVV